MGGPVTRRHGYLVDPLRQPRNREVSGKQALFIVSRGIKGRGIAAGETKDYLGQELGASCPRAFFPLLQMGGKQGDEIDQNRFRLAYDEQIYKRGQRLGIHEGGDTAANHQWLGGTNPVFPVFGKREKAAGQKKTNKVQVIMLKADGKQDQGKVGKGSAGFERPQRDV